jgi:hypothetical protein
VLQSGDAPIITIGINSPKQNQDKTLQECVVLTGLFVIFFTPLSIARRALQRCPPWAQWPKWVVDL